MPPSPLGLPRFTCNRVSGSPEKVSPSPKAPVLHQEQGSLKFTGLPSPDLVTKPRYLTGCSAACLHEPVFLYLMLQFYALFSLDA